MNAFRFSLPRILGISLISGFMGAAMAAAPVQETDGVLTDINGMTLYIFENDVAGNGKSVCNGPCAANWPPLFAMDGDLASGDYSIVMRDDGKKQWAYKGKPLYYWARDRKPGDRTGDGINNLWRPARP